MNSEVAYKRREVLERNLDQRYYGQLIEFHHHSDKMYGRIQTIGIEWEGGSAFTVTINLDSKRLQSDYDTFIRTTKIL